IRLSRENQYERLDKVVRNTIHGFSIESVNIYDPEQVLSYSTEKEKIGTKGTLGELFNRAMKEESISFVASERGRWFDFGFGGNVHKLKTYLPMWEERPMSWKRGKVLGVFEITQNVSHDYEIIWKFQMIVGISFLIFVGILLMTILFIARRAETIIGARTAERIKLEEQLHQAERLAALGEMIAGVSHEIRNPLGIIRSTAELLQSRIENDRQKRLSSIIVEESTRLNDILTEFLDFARPKVLRPSKCRIEEVIDRNLKVIEAEALRLGVSIERDYKTGSYILEADCDLLYRAFLNILANSLQAMPEGGALVVRTHLVNGNGHPSQVEIHFEDTGPGIPQEVVKKIFNPFFTTREKGTGLGLAIVQSIVDNHNGDIEVENRKGKGTAIVIRLPLVQPDSETENGIAV
ncbi:MAG: two-component sensor histidine kinase, partial [Desulfobacteraceae bacterium]|nr:two-component sensor histidine kinase [Desulfobacteraceae bacterium]